MDNLGPFQAENIEISDGLITEGYIDASTCSLSLRISAGLTGELNCSSALTTGLFYLAAIGSDDT